MGFRISYIAAEMPAEALVDALGLEVTGVAGETPHAENWCAQLASGYSILWLEDEVFGLERADMLLALSKQTRVLNCIVNEAVMSSMAICFEGGRERWSMDWRGDDGPVFENLTVQGDPPAGFAAEVERQKQQTEADGGADFYFEIPLNMAAALCGFRHETYLQPTDVDSFRLVGLRKLTPRGIFSSLFGRSK